MSYRRQLGASAIWDPDLSARLRRLRKHTTGRTMAMGKQQAIRFQALGSGWCPCHWSRLLAGGIGGIDPAVTIRLHIARSAHAVCIDRSGCPRWAGVLEASGAVEGDGLQILTNEVGSIC